MSEVLNTMKKRRSIRSFKSEMPKQEAIDAVIEAGLCAASGMNSQASIVIAVTDPDVRARLSAANAGIMGKEEGFDPFYGAPVILVVLADKSYPTAVYDGTLSLGNMMLAACEQGLGSCWIHRAKEEFETEEWKDWLKSLGIEGEYIGIGHLALGYAEGEYPQEIPRKAGRAYRV